MDNQQHIKFNPLIEYQVTLIGNDKTPIIIIDDAATEPENLIALACDTKTGRGEYITQPTDFYPGVRKTMPVTYGDQLGMLLLPLLKSIFNLGAASRVTNVLSAFSITITPPKNLRPVQMVPHFDAVAENQLAVVHYLCDKKHGGTSWYRHKETAFEFITAERLARYGALLKQQAITEKLHQKPHYINGDTTLFERIHQVEARMNRMVIYPSNLLHSGDIDLEMGLLADPQKGRLTVSSFVVVN